MSREAIMRLSTDDGNSTEVSHSEVVESEFRAQPAERPPRRRAIASGRVGEGLESLSPAMRR